MRGSLPIRRAKILNRDAETKVKIKKESKEIINEAADQNILSISEMLGPGDPQIPPETSYYQKHECKILFSSGILDA